MTESDITTGEFTLSGLWPGAFTLNAVSAFSPEPVPYEGRVQTPGETVEVTLRLLATSRVSGRVLLPDGVTVAGAGVEIKLRATTWYDDKGDRLAEPVTRIIDTTVGRVLFNRILPQEVQFVGGGLDRLPCHRPGGQGRDAARRRLGQVGPQFQQVDEAVVRQFRQPGTQRDRCRFPGRAAAAVRVNVLGHC